MAMILAGWDSVTALAFTEDGKRLVAGHGTNAVVFDVTKERVLRKLGAGHLDHGVRALAVHGTVVYALPQSSWGLARWDLTTGRYHGRVIGEPPAAGFSLSHDGTALIVARAKTIETFDTSVGLALFDPKRRKPKAKFAATRDELSGVALARDGTILFWSERSWGISNDGRSVAFRKDDPVQSAGFVGPRPYLVRTNELMIGDARTGKPTHKTKLRGHAWLSCASADRIFVGTERALHVFDWDGQTLSDAYELAAAGLSGLACTHDGKQAAFAVAEETRTVVRVLSLGAQKKVSISRAPAAAVKPRVKPMPALSENDPLWGVPEEEWSANHHLDFREYVANEHLIGKMPIAELSRNHDIPLSRVRRWIELYRVGGRKALGDALGALRSYR